MSGENCGRGKGGVEMFVVVAANAYRAFLPGLAQRLACCRSGNPLKVSPRRLANDIVQGLAHVSQQKLAKERESRHNSDVYYASHSTPRGGGTPRRAMASP